MNEYPAPAQPCRASQHRLALCHDCHHLNHYRPSPGCILRCHYCQAQLHLRQPNSLARSWALLITSAILLIPANIYPVMTVIYFGKGAPDTIMSGVMHLLHAGMYALALLVFVASVAVPVMKLAGMAILLLHVQRGSRLSAEKCTRMYRFIELIGRWSMLDLFMISILVTLVDLGKIATITAGPGSTAFASVVVLTMLAAMTFDSRLIWDLQEDRSQPSVDNRL